MNVADLTPRQRSIRAAVRAFLMTAARAELQQEYDLSVTMSDRFRAACVAELIAEFPAED